MTVTVNGVAPTPTQKQDFRDVFEIPSDTELSAAIVSERSASATLSNKTLENPVYTGTLTGGTGVVNLGSGQFVKDDSGNVGVGTATPTQKVTVNNASASNTYANFTNSNASNGLIVGTAADGSGILGTVDGRALKLLTGSVERGQFDSAGNFGIGTASPASKTHIEQGTYSTPGLTISASTETSRKYQLSMVAGGNFALTDTAAAVQRFVVDSAGNLGLGVTPSAWSMRAMQVGGAGALSGDANTVALSQNVYGAIYSGFGATYAQSGQSALTFELDKSSGSFKWKLAPSGTAGNPISFTQAMTLDASSNLKIAGKYYARRSSGALDLPVLCYSDGVSGSALTGNVGDNVAVGTAGAGDLLFVVGNSSVGRFDTNGNLLVGKSAPFNATTDIGTFERTQNAATNVVVSNQQDHAAASANLSIQAYGGGATISVPRATPGTNSLVFTLHGTERARIDSSGNLLVGTTTNTFVSRLVLGGGSSNKIETVSSSTINTYHQIFTNPNGTVGSIETNGSATNFVTSSDARLKENISDAAPGSALIDQLQVRQFDWKADGSHQRYGFVAQELDAVFPEAVSKPADPQQMMGVDYSKLVPLLVQEVQSLRARLAVLEAKQ